MLNPDLQKDIDVEIDKAEADVADFLRSDYFRDTMDLIIRVNKLTDEQAEGVELETMLYILKLSDHVSIEEAVRDECSIETAATVSQVVSDLKRFVFDKLGPVQTIRVVSDTVATDKPLRSAIHDAYGKEITAPPIIDYYENKRQMQKMAPMVTENIPKKVTLTAPEVMHDVYREVPDASDEGREDN